MFLGTAYALPQHKQSDCHENAKRRPLKSKWSKMSLVMMVRRWTVTIRLNLCPIIRVNRWYSRVLHSQVLQQGRNILLNRAQLCKWLGVLGLSVRN